MAGPTRGGDWDDNAALRQIHAHTWALTILGLVLHLMC